MASSCSQCGLCCRLFLINLSKEEYQSRTYKTQFDEFGHINNFKKASFLGANLLKQKEDGGCIYLEKNRCSIHQKRPQVCRVFFCNSKLDKFKSMIKKINSASQKKIA